MATDRRDRRRPGVVFAPPRMGPAWRPPAPEPQQSQGTRVAPVPRLSAEQKAAIQNAGPSGSGSDSSDGYGRGLGFLINNPVTKAALKPLQALDVPRRVALSGLKEGIDELSGEGGSWSDFADQVGDEQFGFGSITGDLTGNKWLDRGIGLAGDIVFDPMTYLTFGAAPAAKGVSLSGRASRVQRVADATAELSRLGRLDAPTVAALREVAERGYSRATPELQQALKIKAPGARLQVPFTNIRTGALPYTEGIARGVNRPIEGARQAFNTSKRGQRMIATRTPQGLEQIMPHITGGVGSDDQFKTAITGFLSDQYSRTPAGAFKSIAANELNRRFPAVQAELDTRFGGSMEALLRESESGARDTTLNNLSQRMVEIAKSQGVDLPEIEGIGYLPHMLSPEFRSLLSSGHPLAEQFKRAVGIRSEDTLRDSGFLQARAFLPDPTGKRKPIKIGNQEIRIVEGTIPEINAVVKQVFPELKTTALETDPRALFERYIEGVAEDVGGRAARSRLLEEGLGGITRRENITGQTDVVPHNQRLDYGDGVFRSVVNEDASAKANKEAAETQYQIASEARGEADQLRRQIANAASTERTNLQAPMIEEVDRIGYNKVDPTTGEQLVRKDGSLKGEGRITELAERLRGIQETVASAPARQRAIEAAATAEVSSLRARIGVITKQIKAMHRAVAGRVAEDQANYVADVQTRLQGLFDEAAELRETLALYGKTNQAIQSVQSKLAADLEQAQKAYDEVVLRVRGGAPPLTNTVGEIEGRVSAVEAANAAPAARAQRELSGELAGRNVDTEAIDALRAQRAAHVELDRQIDYLDTSIKRTSKQRNLSDQARARVAEQKKELSGLRATKRTQAAERALVDRELSNYEAGLRSLESKRTGIEQLRRADEVVTEVAETPAVVKVRDELEALRTQRAEFRELDREIESLQSRIDNVVAKQKPKPRLTAAQRAKMTPAEIDAAAVPPRQIASKKQIADWRKKLRQLQSEKTKQARARDGINARFNAKEAEFQRLRAEAPSGARQDDPLSQEVQQASRKVWEAGWKQSRGPQPEPINMSRGPAETSLPPIAERMKIKGRVRNVERNLKPTFDEAGAAGRGEGRVAEIAAEGELEKGYRETIPKLRQAKLRRKVDEIKARSGQEIEAINREVAGSQQEYLDTVREITELGERRRTLQSVIAKGGKDPAKRLEQSASGLRPTKKALSELNYVETDSLARVQPLQESVAAIDEMARLNPDATDADLLRAEVLLRRYNGMLKQATTRDLTAAQAEAVLAKANKGQLVDVVVAQLDDALWKMAPEGDVFLSTELSRMMVNLAKVRNDPKLLGSTLTAFTNFFKTYATLSPGFHVRNAISATFMNSADGVPLARQFQGVGEWKRFLKAKDPLAYYDALDPQMKQAFDAVFGSGAGGRFFESGVAETTMIGRTKLKEGIFRNRATVWSQKQGQRVEGSVRLGMAIDTIKNGGSVEDALNRITRIHFDYSQVSQFDENAKRLIPFWTFMSRNMPMQLSQMWMKPKMYLRYQSLVRNFSVDPAEFTPEYILEAGGFDTGLDTPGGVPGMGKDMPIFLQPDLAHSRLTEDFEKIENVLSGGNIGQLASDFNPFFTAPVEYVTGKDLYTGRQYQDDDYRKLSGPIDKALLPLLTILGQVKEGEDGYYVQEKGFDFLKSIVPPLDRVSRLAPTTTGGQASDRQLESMARFFGVPMRTISPDQIEGERRSQYYDKVDEERLRRVLAGLP